ncbi:MAG: fibro-slime domain-containing protein [Phycisphaerales bacterium]
MNVIARSSILIAALAVTGSPTIAASKPQDGRATIELTAVVRDFIAYKDSEHASGHHPDFQRWSGQSRVGLVDTKLDEDGKPVVADLAGWRVKKQYKDADNNNINPLLVLDGTLTAKKEGELERRSDRRIESAESFAQWYRDVPGINISKSVGITLEETSAGSGVFVYDSRDGRSKQLNPWMKDLAISGFFPLNNEGFGNYAHHAGGSTNYHFTTEVSTTFNFQRGEDWRFTFSGDDDVWVFIDGKLVIDLGGVHSREEQSIALDELDWLEDGRNYSLKIFHAERRTVQSNFMITTTIPLTPIAAVSTFDAFD